MSLLISNNYKNQICCVKKCTNRETATATLLTFPDDIVEQLKWKSILNIHKPISDLIRVCSEHFKESDFIESKFCR